MYTSYIGNKFLRLYNERTNNSLSAAEFFDKILYPLFFAKEPHLMHVSNSPFFQKVKEDEIQSTGLNKSAIQYQNLRIKVESVTKYGSEADASFHVGFSAAGPLQTTSGQVSSLSVPMNENEIYTSWIGNALAIRVEGSQCLLIDCKEVLWKLYEGWIIYREYLNQTPSVKGRQIETWNGQWLARNEDGQIPNALVSGGSLETNSWVEVLAKLSTYHPNESISAYIFSLGQTNSTFGFLNLHLPHFVTLGRLKAQFFEFKDESDQKFWNAYASEFSLREACKMGEIGLRALKPRDFSKILEKDFSFVKITDKNRKQFSLYKLWIIAMLNNKLELQKIAADLARSLNEFETGGINAKRGKTADNAHAKEVFEARSSSQFIKAISDFLEASSAENKDVCRKTVNQVLEIPGEQLPLFKALIRFEYIYLKS